jgi:general secretion pathway protein E
MKGEGGEAIEIIRERYPDGRKPTFYHAVGCDACGQTGYSGRLAIYELLMVSDEIRSLVTKNVDATVIKRQAVSDGMVTLMQDGGMKVLDGITTAEEVFRVAQATDEVL